MKEWQHLNDYETHKVDTVTPLHLHMQKESI